jgi:HPt (histidine-containing phosphotransfer) domain-containing protein
MPLATVTAAGTPAAAASALPPGAAPIAAADTGFATPSAAPSIMPLNAGAAVTLDSEAALRQLGGLLPVYQIALRSFGNEALALERQLLAALEKRDAAAARAPLHVLKGLAGTVGAQALARLAASAEHAMRAAMARGEEPDDYAREQAGAVLAALPLAISAAVAQLDRPAPGAAHS